MLQIVVSLLWSSGWSLCLKYRLLVLLCCVTKFHSILWRNTLWLIQFWCITLTFVLAFNAFESLQWNFGLVWTGLKFQNFQLGKGESWKYQYRSHLVCGSGCLRSSWRVQTGKTNWRGRFSTFDLLVLTSLGSAAFEIENSIYFFYQTSYPNEEVNCSEPSSSVSVIKHWMTILFLPWMNNCVTG